MDKIRVLIVDDTFFMRETLKKYLQETGKFEIIEAVNGADAVRKYREYNPFVVSMDVTMPVMDGKEALKKIKEYDKTANVMMSTAIGQENQVKECLLCGCSNYLVKPFSKEVFLKKISEMVKRGILMRKCPYRQECNGCSYKDICRVEK